MTAVTFGTDFDTRADVGDTIETTLGPIRFVATLHHDDDTSAPDKRQDGFWPSLDPNDCGFIGPAFGKRALALRMAHAESIMADWKARRMFYVGVDVRAYLGEVPITDEFESALWGLECNWQPYNKRDRCNAYLRTVANELLPDVLLDVARLLNATGPNDWLAVLSNYQ